MKYRQRTLEKTIKKASRTFPAIVITGPRQSGKTTLLKTLFKDSHEYVSLENPDVRIRAKDDPRLFLDRHKPPVIFDEIQYVPELLPYIKSAIDDNRKPGNWLLTGSQHFALMQGVTESLAGRAANLSLLPFSLAEMAGITGRITSPERWLQKNTWKKELPINKSLASILLRGFYPEIAGTPSVDRQLWCSSYITTYLERDIRNLASIGDLSQFERFLQACAIRTGQILNLSDVARDIGISVPTAKRWLSLLETGNQVFLIYPYYSNLGKRLVKSPKLYFNDTALCTLLLGLHQTDTLTGSPHFGNIFETLVVADIRKRFLHAGLRPPLYYIRTRDKLEIDLVIELGGKLHLFEIKSAMTVTAKHASSLVKLKQDASVPCASMGIISQAPEVMEVRPGIKNCYWKSFLAG